MRILQAAAVIFACAAFVLAGGTTPRREDVPKYLDMLLKSSNAKDRALGAEMLGKRGAINRKDVEAAIEPLKTALQKDIDIRVKVAAAGALGNISPAAETTVPLLIDALANKSIDLKLAAIDALGQYGPEAKAALTKLREIAKDKADKKLSGAAATALKSITAKKG